MKPLETLLRSFVELHPEEATRAFETLELADAARLFRNLPLHVVSQLLDRLSPEIAVPLLEQLDPERMGRLISGMAPRAAAAALRRLAPATRDQAIAQLKPAVAKPLKDLFEFPEDTAGGMMTPHVASFSIDLTAQQVIAKIRRTPAETLHYLYVTDRDGKLIGVLSMRDLLLKRPQDPIATSVRFKVISVPGTQSREEALTVMREHGFVALPVTDFEGRLIGVIKHEDAMMAGQMEAFEDMQVSVGAGADERALSPVTTVVKSRFPWLVVNLITAFLASSVIGLFEGMIAQVAALAVLLPIVAGQGGNTGSQSLAVVMRGLALREIIAGARRKVVVKEALGGLINGVAIAAITAGCVFAWRVVSNDTWQASYGMAAVIGLAMVINMVVAATAGAIIPLILKALGRDPAQSAAIFLTTVTDIVGFGAFLGLAAGYIGLMGA